MSRILLTLSAFAALLLSLSIANAGDLKTIRDAQKLAAQKLAQDVDNLIDASRKQNPTDAKFKLREMINRVKDSSDLFASERQALVNRLQARLNAVEEAIRSKNIIQEQTPPRDLPKQYRPPVNDPGKGVSALAKGTIDPRRDTLRGYNDLQNQRNQGIQGLNEGIEKAGIVPDKDVTLAKDHKEKMERRAQKLTEQEVKVLKALNSTLSIDYDDDFKSVLNHMMDRTGLTIIVDEGSMQEANVDYKDKVTLKFPKLTVRTALKKILGDRGLTYIIKEGNLQVMTPKKASEYTVFRTYLIDDLVAIDPRLQLMFGPFVAQAQKARNAQSIINMIQSTIEPSYWQPNGPGSIVYEPLSGALIIRASAEMHYQLPSVFGTR